MKSKKLNIIFIINTIAFFVVPTLLVHERMIKYIFYSVFLVIHFYFLFVYKNK